MTSNNKVEKKGEITQTVQAQKTSAVSQQIVPLPAVKVDSAPKPVEERKLSQRDVVFVQVSHFLKERNIKVEKSKPILPVLKKEDLAVLCEKIVKEFETGKATLRATESNAKKLADKKELTKYCMGLLMNWLRRDPRLNGVQEFPNA